MATLEARYRRLLWAYPKRYRNLRGLEMLTTLLDGAGGDRARPTLLEVKDLIVGGLRCRLRLPGGKGVVVLALLVAFCLGTGGALAGIALGWSTTTPLPQGINNSQLVAEAVGLTDQPLTPTVEPTIEYNRVSVGPPAYVPDWTRGTVRTTQPVPVMALAQDRLAAGGWQVGPLDARHGFVATKGDLTLTVEPGRDSITFGIERGRPIAVTGLALAGTVLGVLLGWLLTGWCVRRAFAGAPTDLYATTVLATLGLALLVPVQAAYVAGMLAAYVPFVPASLPFPSDTRDLFWFVPAGMGGFGVLALLLALLVAGASREVNRDASGSTRTVARR